jgi:hypothetical protein
MSNDMASTEASSDEKDDSFSVLMHRLESAIHRLKLAAEDLSGLADTMPAEEHGSAAFVVAETMEALNQLYRDLNAWDKTHHCLGICNLLRRSVTTRWTECSAAAPSSLPPSRQ